MDPSSLQGAILALVIFLLPLVVQGLRWFFSRIGYVPKSKNWPRLLVLGTSYLLFLLFNLNVFPAFPALAGNLETIVFQVLNYVQAMYMAIVGVIAGAGLIYEKIWKPGFEAAEKSKMPVIKELATKNIKQ